MTRILSSNLHLVSVKTVKVYSSLQAGYFLKACDFELKSKFYSDTILLLNHSDNAAETSRKLGSSGKS